MRSIHFKPARPPRCLRAAVLTASLTAFGASAAEPLDCNDILYLIEQSRSRFVEIRIPRSPEPGRYGSTLVIADASQCSIVEDAEKTSYQCTWDHALGDPLAGERYIKLMTGIRGCIGNFTEERVDRPVNHPDIFASYIYQYENGEVGISLKNKSSLGETRVTVGVDGFKTKE